MKFLSLGMLCGILMTLTPSQAEASMVPPVLRTGFFKLVLQQTSEGRKIASKILYGEAQDRKISDEAVEIFLGTMERPEQHALARQLAVRTKRMKHEFDLHAPAVSRKRIDYVEQLTTRYMKLDPTARGVRFAETVPASVYVQAAQRFTWLNEQQMMNPLRQAIHGSLLSTRETLKRTELTSEELSQVFHSGETFSVARDMRQFFNQYEQLVHELEGALKASKQPESLLIEEASDLANLILRAKTLPVTDFELKELIWAVERADKRVVSQYRLRHGLFRYRKQADRLAQIAAEFRMLSVTR